MRAIRRFFEKLSILEELTIENPLGQDYAEYVVRNNRWHEAEEHFTKQQLKKLKLPNKVVNI